MNYIELKKSFHIHINQFDFKQQAICIKYTFDINFVLLLLKIDYQKEGFEFICIYK